jgi:hypothetical protein
MYMATIIHIQIIKSIVTMYITWVHFVRHTDPYPLYSQ